MRSGADADGNGVSVDLGNTMCLLEMWVWLEIVGFALISPPYMSCARPLGIPFDIFSCQLETPLGLSYLPTTQRVSRSCPFDESAHLTTQPA